MNDLPSRWSMACLKSYYCIALSFILKHCLIVEEVESGNLYKTHNTHGVLQKVIYLQLLYRERRLFFGVAFKRLCNLNLMNNHPPY